MEPMEKNTSAEKAVREIRRKTRRWFSAEEKIRIVIEGLRGEESIASLRRREGIAANLYYLYGLLPLCKRRFANGLSMDRLQTSIRRHPPKWSAQMGRPPTHASIAGRPRRLR
jgi:transposase